MLLPQLSGANVFHKGNPGLASRWENPMLKSVMIVAAAFALAVSADAAVQQQPAGTSQLSPQARQNQFVLPFTLSCVSFQVGGNAPSIQFTNNGPGIVPAGTVVHWVVKASNGDYTIPYPLQVHQITVLNGVARSGIGGCTISVVH